MEVDFLIRKEAVTSRHNILPVEVKSSSRFTVTSLEKFKRKFTSYIGESYVMHTGDLEIKDGTVFLPLYMAGLM